MNPTLKDRDEKIVASIINPESMLLGPTSSSLAVLEYLTEQLNKKPNELAPKAIAKSLFYIAQSGQPEQAAKVLIPIANNKELDPLVRQDAINSLGLLPSKFADSSLATALIEDNNINESIVLKVMAMAGNKDSLKALRSLNSATNDRTMKLRTYAETMITLRLGEKISDNNALRSLPKTIPISFNREDLSSLKQTINSIEGKPFGLEFNEEFGFSFDCASCKHTILFSANFKSDDLIKSIHQSQICGIIVMDDKASGRSVVRRSILLHPDKKTTRVSVLRTDGKVALAGELRPDGDNLRLFLRDLGTEVRPIQVSGIISNDKIELNADTFWSVAKTKLTGIPIN